MRTPIIRATSDASDGHYKIIGQCLDEQGKLVHWGFSTFSVVRFEAELKHIKEYFDCQIVREFKA